MKLGRRILRGWIVKSSSMNSVAHDSYTVANEPSQSVAMGISQDRIPLDIRDETTNRREHMMCLAGLFSTLLVQFAPAHLAAAHIVRMEAGHQNKLISLLRKRGVRGGLRADVSAILGLYNRGDNMLVARMSVKRGEAILTFARIVMRHRELYYWALQPDIGDRTTYFFLTNGSFNLVARGVELKDDKAAVLPAERTETLFAEVTKSWIAILDES